MPDWRRNFRYTWLNNFLTAAGMMAFLPVLPLYVREMGVEDPDAVKRWSGFVTGSAPFVAAFLAPVWGELGDRHGFKIMMVRCNIAIMLFVGSMSLVTSPWMLLALRIGQGAFSGFLAPAMTLVSIQTPDEKQGRVTGLLQTGALSGSVFGPFLGGLVGDAFGLRAAFALCAGLSFLALLVTMVGVREPERAVSPDRGRTTVGDLVLTALRSFFELLAPGPLRSLLVVVFLVRFSGILINPVLALFVENLGVQPDRLATLTGAVFVAAGVANLMFASPWAYLGERYGHRQLLVGCAAAAGIVFIGTGFVTRVDALIVMRFLAAGFLAGVFPAAYAMATQLSPVERRGRTHGFTFSALALANSLGPVGGGEISAAWGLRATFFVSAGLLFLPALFLGGLHAGRARRERSRRRQGGAGSDAPEAEQPTSRIQR
ncbi:MAG: MFS transporter [Planctomycetota bacterium]